MEFDENRFKVIDHPLVQHKLSILRDKNTVTKDFRQLVTELAMLEGYEAMRDFPLEDCVVETPLETATFKRVAGKKVAIIPILRAGLGMVDGILALVPSARVGHVGMYRDPETHEPVQYYCKFPPSIEDRTCLIVDPMLATGGSLIAAIKYLRDAGAKDVRALTIVSSPEGVKAVLDYDPNVRLYTCALDRELNDAAYILPGLGDAGDRIYGTL
ncbi:MULTISPECIES: uracil phosphoribosyltransferase [Atopobiaceae]|uniref:Uracil phosphoribosyltransferase n=1 Tax=Parafannyhessea umbonata TaxID=604330 RepID=A0A1H9Q9M8_9ACTN|nr:MULTISPECIES: uracil phosphoribosyltransferase [Atopobiaceae]SEH65717.1 uracil phosphoribosyltransferase [Parafannyhessea umbonata]SER56589.1 uracil phosphoribosyltransferase [Parafannyhessea umbonata]SJZ64665.1 uracil phosphoribosyltransferase [Olsenella sp. KH1P3]